VVVLFALLIPVLFAIGAIVIDIGNFYVHKRHLQTQVDAAALAGGGLFTGCFEDDPTFVDLTNNEIRDEAEKYAGDWLRDSSTANLQLQEPGDVRVALNSATYWKPSDGLSASTGYGLDDTIASPGDPCSMLELDVKATDHEAPLLWGLIPLHPSPKSHAVVEVQRAREMRILPWAVPDVDPLVVAAFFINEETGEVLCVGPLDKPPVNPLPQFNLWEGDVGCETSGQFDVSSQNIGVIVLVSKHPSPALPNIGDTPPYTCNQAPRRWNCYAGSTGDGSSSLSFIHGYDDDASGSVANPVVKDVRLTPGDCTSDPGNLSAPYFVLEGPCNAGVEAVVDFGSAAPDPRDFPICAIVEANGAGMTWSPGGIGGPLGTWTTSGAPIGLAAESGRTVVNLHWWSGPKRPPNPPVACGTNKSQRQQDGPFPKVAAPYVANDDPSQPADSGPVEFLELTTLGGATANSLPDGLGPPIHVAVGLKPALTGGELVGIRVSSDDPASKTQTIDCDNGITADDEIIDGCRTPYVLNLDDWDKDDSTPDTWRDIECADYDPANSGSPTWRYTLPPGPPYSPSPRPDCARIQTGVDNGKFRRAMHERFETPCYPNKWGKWADAKDKATDPRWVTIVITDATAFEGSGGSPSDSIPVKILGAFYPVGWNYPGVPAGWGCIGENVAPPKSLTLKTGRGDVWGYFDKHVLPSGGAPSGEKCALTGLDVCVAVLVE
jgi:hypothetical protein